MDIILAPWTLISTFLFHQDDEVIEEALHHIDDYILKPEREGGGNNYYGEEILPVWNRVRHTPERHVYILMKRIKPPFQLNCVLPCEAQESCLPFSMVSELGIYGAALWLVALWKSDVWQQCT